MRLVNKLFRRSMKEDKTKDSDFDAKDVYGSIIKSSDVETESLKESKSKNFANIIIDKIEKIFDEIYIHTVLWHIFNIIMLSFGNAFIVRNVNVPISIISLVCWTLFMSFRSKFSRDYFIIISKDEEDEDDVDVTLYSPMWVISYLGMALSYFESMTLLVQPIPACIFIISICEIAQYF